MRSDMRNEIQDLRSKIQDAGFKFLESRNKNQDTRGEMKNKGGDFFSNVKQSWLLVLTSWFLILTCVSLVSCSSDDDETIAPKPRSYFRLSFPEKKYVTYDSVCPFTFEMPVYSRIDKDKNFGAEPCWLNLDFPTFNGTLHLSYKAVNGNIKDYLEDTYTLVSKHQIKAAGIEEQRISRDSSKVYGLIYEIKGNAASSIQFFLTDSTHHFIRGALYFNAIPNTDSIAPVLEFIKEDIHKIISTLQWKNDSNF